MDVVLILCEVGDSLNLVVELSAINRLGWWLVGGIAWHQDGTLLSILEFA